MNEVLSESRVVDQAAAAHSDAAARTMLHSVLAALVEEADKLELVYLAIDCGVAFQVRCAVGDVGRVIGGNGRTAQAIRTILSAIAAKHGRRYTLDIAQ